MIAHIWKISQTHAGKGFQNTAYKINFFISFFNIKICELLTKIFQKTKEKIFFP